MRHYTNENRLVLEEASEKHREAALGLKQEFLEAGETVMNGSALLDQMEFDEWLANCISNGNPETVRDDWAVATTYFATRVCDGAVVGIIASGRRSVDAVTPPKCWLWDSRSAGNSESLLSASAAMPTTRRQSARLRQTGASW